MRVLFLTQSKSLALFHDVAESIRDQVPGSESSFYVADSTYYRKFLQIQPDFEKEYPARIYEWDILATAANRKPDKSFLLAKEKEFGEPLWNAVVADRRLFLGPAGAYRDDRGTAYSHNKLMAIVETGIRELEALIDSFKPDIIVSFICVTIGEYLAARIAWSRAIPFMNLRPTRIRNYFFGGEDVTEPSENLEREYRNLLQNGMPPDLAAKVDDYLSFTREKHGLYEGVLPTKDVKGIKLSKTGKKNSYFGKAIDAWRMAREYSSGSYRYDNHYQGFFAPTWFKWVERPARLKRVKKEFAAGYIREKDLDAVDYVFYPLHKEPEVTLLVYGRSFINQVEVIQRIARNLPVGMKLLVKEHPAGQGYHPIEFYREILDMPNIKLVSPDIQGRTVVQKARMIAIVCGSVGLEGLILKKPVLAFGRAPFEFLPDGMIRSVGSLDSLDHDIRDLLEQAEYDEDAMRAYVGAIMELSVPIDFYSRLLGRSNVYQASDGADPEQVRGEHIARLAKYINERLVQSN